MWWWEVVDEKDPERIEIVTWKGVYVVDNKKPDLPRLSKRVSLLELLGLSFAKYLKKRSFRTIMTPMETNPLWTFEYGAVNQRVWDRGFVLQIKLEYNPLTQTWGRCNAMNKLCKWALKQPPQPDHEGAQGDRESVKETFEELDKSVQVKSVPSK